MVLTTNKTIAGKIDIIENYKTTWEGEIFTPRSSLNSKARLDSGMPPPIEIDHEISC